MMEAPNLLKSVLRILSLVSMTTLSFGQGLTNETNMYVPDALDVSIDGSLVNKGFIQNQGTISVNQDWLNSNIYQGLGTVHLGGTSLQQVNNNGNAIQTLVVTGGGRKRIIGSIPVSKSLELKEGIIIVTDQDDLTLAAGVTINGGSSSSFINGALTHTGVGYKFFPIGNDGGYYPAELLDINGVNIVTSMQVLNNQGAIAPIANFKLFSDVYWQRKTISGSFLSSSLSLGYTIPDSYTDTHTLDILQSETPGSALSALGKISVDYQAGIDKITSSTPATAPIFVIGESSTTPSNPAVGKFYLPTSLSPSATDPSNRSIKVFGDELIERDFLFVVYNRWGLKVYETHSLYAMANRGWEGQHENSGDNLPSGAYPFLLKATTKSGEQIEKKGSITVIR